MSLRGHFRFLAQWLRRKPRYATGGTIQPRQDRGGAVGPFLLSEGCGYRVGPFYPRPDTDEETR